jgi:hypothetical protein
MHLSSGLNWSKKKLPNTLKSWDGARRHGAKKWLPPRAAKRVGWN